MRISDWSSDVCSSDLLARSVNPLAGVRTATQVGADIAATDRQDPLEGSKTPKALTRSSSPSIHPSVVRPSLVAVLDSSWERRIKRGVLRPEISIDLHGHSLALAHKRFDQAVAQALIEGVRVLLIITGKSRRRGISQGRPGRGARRAESGQGIVDNPFA